MKILAYILLFVAVAAPMSALFSMIDMMFIGVLCGIAVVLIEGICQIIKKLEEIKTVLENKPEKGLEGTKK